MNGPVAKKVNQVESIVNRASRWLNIASCIVLAALATMTVTEIVARYFDHPIRGALDFTQMFMIGIAFFALANTQVFDNHVKADMIYRKFPAKFKKIIDRFNLGIALIVWGVITWRLFAYASYLNRVGTELNALPVQRFIFVYPAILGTFILLLVLLIHFIKGRPPKGKDIEDLEVQD